MQEITNSYFSSLCKHSHNCVSFFGGCNTRTVHISGFMAVAPGMNELHDFSRSWRSDVLSFIQLMKVCVMYRARDSCEIGCLEFWTHYLMIEVRNAGVRLSLSLSYRDSCQTADPNTHLYIRFYVLKTFFPSLMFFSFSFTPVF